MSDRFFRYRLDQRWKPMFVVLGVGDDDGLTFGTDRHRGLCIEFIEPVRKVIGMRNHSALWASVRGLAATLD